MQCGPPYCLRTQAYMRFCIVAKEPVALVLHVLTMLISIGTAVCMS